MRTGFKDIFKKTFIIIIIIQGSQGGKHCESLQRDVRRKVVSQLKAVPLDIEKRIFVVICEKWR